MNDNPPPLGQPAQPQPHSYAQNTGSGKKTAAGCGIGCLVVLVVGVILSVIGGRFVKGKITDVIDTYTADEAVEIVAPEIAEPVRDDAMARFDTFRTAMATNNPAEPLVLSEEDINSLIFHHPSFDALKGSAIVSIEDNLLNAEVSFDLDSWDIPIEFLADAVKGKFFNGDITLSVGMVASRPALFVEDLSVGGIQFPSMYLEELRKENLLKDVQSEPELRKIFDKVRELKIENNQLVIVPANTP